MGVTSRRVLGDATLVRLAGPEDADGLLVLQQRLDEQSSFMLLEPGERPADPTGVRERLRAQTSSGSFDLIAASEEGRVIGWVAVEVLAYRRAAHVGYLVLGVDASATGAGVGRSLLDAATREASLRGLRRLELTVMVDNVRAIALYERAGFDIEGTRQHAVHRDGLLVDEYTMALLLPGTHPEHHMGSEPRHNAGAEHRGGSGDRGVRLSLVSELSLLRDADERARRYTAGMGTRRVFPAPDVLAERSRFEEPVPVTGWSAASTLALLDDVGSPAAVETTGARYFGFVTGATLPVAAAADRMVLAWDNTATTPMSSPVADRIERVAGRWVLDILDLPADASVAFTTSSGSGTLAALATARRTLMDRAGWDVDQRGLTGAPPLRVVVSENAHVVVRKALRVLGFGSADIHWTPVDEYGRVDPERLPEVDACTILILQAGDVNTGECDPFAAILDACTPGWVHIDGAFGLWARASSHKHLTEGAERADSWTVDGHKWLNTPYDSAITIIRDHDAATRTLHSDAVYAPSTSGSQKDLTMEFSRRARGVPVWAALRTLGTRGVAALVDESVAMAQQAADGLRDAGFTVLNRVVLNQVLVTCDDPRAVADAARATGDTWFGDTVWRGIPAFRISVSSWRTRPHHIDALVALLGDLRTRQQP